MFSKKIEIVEVGPRDGFQNVREFIPTEIKLQVIEGIIRAGINNIQITSFVHPLAVPQMKDAGEITGYCLKKYPELSLSALVPNYYGAKMAVEMGLKRITYVISLSQTHNLRNVKRSHDESFAELSEIIRNYPTIELTLDIATSFGCHYEGEMPIDRLIAFIERTYAIGVRKFDLCDTVGLAHPQMVEETIKSVLSGFRDAEFQVHIHDTRNMGIVCSHKAIESGISKIQTSIGGLGGCPFAPGASGNTSTEDFVYMLNKMGYDTGVDEEKLISTAKYLKANVEGNYSGHNIFVDLSALSCQ